MSFPWPSAISCSESEDCITSATSSSIINIRLLQLGDSALPIGGYSHSWGLEAAIDQGQVRDPASLERWLASWLEHILAPAEGVVVAAVTRAAREEHWGEVVRANVLLAASLTPP